MQKKETVKNGKLVGWVVMFIVIGFMGGAVMPDKQKKYKVEMTLEEINSLVYCLQQSNAPSVTTNALINIITTQVNPILQQEQKKITDSLNKLTPKNIP